MNVYDFIRYQDELDWYWYERGLEDGEAGEVLGEVSDAYWYQEGYSQGKDLREE